MNIEDLLRQLFHDAKSIRRHVRRFPVNDRPHHLQGPIDAERARRMTREQRNALPYDEGRDAPVQQLHTGPTTLAERRCVGN